MSARSNTESTSIDPSDWKDLVVICSGSAWDSWFPSEKHIAIQLSSSFPVLYVDPPTNLTVAIREKRSPEGLRIVKPGLAVLSSLTIPAPSWKYMRPIASAIAKWSIRRAAAALGQKRAKAHIIANHQNLFGAVPADKMILYATDNFVAGAELMGLPKDYLIAQQAAQARSANAVAVVTDDLRSHWAALGHNPVLIPNGCDTDRFRNVDDADWPKDVTLPKPIAGVFGHLSERIDIRLLEAVADRGISLLLVGSRKASFSLDSLTRRPNVVYLGPKPFESMTGYLKAIDVGLTPYSDCAFNKSSFPLKTLEYLAAGRPVVSTSLPAVEWLNCDDIHAKDTPEGFADAAAALLDEGRSEKRLRNCQAFAEKHSWKVRAEQMAALIDS
ncbi:MAG: glycosyltransferase [Rhizobiaceae bacterium]|nr:glycosyltransferase [Rhizobiaceae bacterium]